MEKRADGALKILLRFLTAKEGMIIKLLAMGKEPNLLCVMAFPSVLILELIVFLNPKHRRELPKNIPRIIGAGIMSAIFVPILAIQFFYWVRGNIIIATLDPQSVESIAVNDCTFTKPDEINSIVITLNHSTMLMPNHETTGPEVPMTVTFRSGEVEYYRISKLMNGVGARLLFIRPHGDDAYWADQNALVPTLTDVLNTLNCQLPAKR